MRGEDWQSVITSTSRERGDPFYDKGIASRDRVVRFDTRRRVGFRKTCNLNATAKSKTQILFKDLRLIVILIYLGGRLHCNGSILLACIG